ncbi:MAG: C4-dicarboxylate ABC transporter, partial [Bradyrhizobium sp. 35-63-5]
SRQKKAIDDHCTSEWAGKIAAPWAKFEHDGIAKIKAEAGQDVYDISPAQLAEWQKAAAPLTAQWAEGAKKAGIDADAALKELKADLKKENAAY